MNNRITDYESLLSEKQRLKVLLNYQKSIVREDVLQLKKQLEPASKLLSTVGKFTGNSTAKPLLQMGLDLGVDVLLRNTLFRKAGFAAKLAMPYLLRNLSGNLINGNGKRKGILQSIGNLFSRKSRTNINA